MPEAPDEDGRPGVPASTFAAEADAAATTVASVVRPGPTLTGGQRRRVVAVARGEVAGDGGPLDDLAHLVGHEAHTIRAETVERFAARGVDAATYTEVLGIVSRITAVDTLCFALGLDLGDPGDPSADPPTGEIDESADIDGGWIPTVGPAWPPSVLSALPSEHRLWEELHGVLYLSTAGMADLDADRGLHRTQMELVAARTSLLNECFF